MCLRYQSISDRINYSWISHSSAKANSNNQRSSFLSAYHPSCCNTPLILLSWTTSWCRRQSTHPSGNAGAGGLRISARRISSRSRASRLPRCFRARSADRRGAFSVVKPARPLSTPSGPPYVPSKTATRTLTRPAASTPSGKDPPNCNRPKTSPWASPIASLHANAQTCPKRDSSEMIPSAILRDNWRRIWIILAA